MDAAQEMELNAKAERAEEQLDRRVRAVIIKADGNEEKISEKVAHSKGLPDDPFESIADDIIKPPYDPRRCIIYSEWSAALSSSVGVMEVNISGFGHSLISTFPKGAPDELEEDVDLEVLELENNLLIFARDMSLTKLRRKLRRDRTLTGNAYLEVIRNPKTGRWVAGGRRKSYRMRLLKQDSYLTEYKMKVPQIKRDRSIEYIEIPVARRFRRYVEVTTGGVSSYEYRYYKQYGDPRVVDNETGEYVSEKKVKDFDGEGHPMPESRKASEIYHWGDSDRSPYGIPEWISALASILGTRSGELVNLHTLENNGVPSMVITVSNGRLTDDTIERITQFVNNHVKGNANYSTFLVLEGEGELEGDESNHVKIGIEPLQDTQVREMLFGEYIATNEQRTAQSFRIAPIYQGVVGQYNKATADISRRLTDEQVFAPERDEDDWWFNTILWAEWEVRFHRFLTNTPNITDNKDLIAAAVALERAGGMTPRIAREIAKVVYPALAQFLAFKEKKGPDGKPLMGEIDPDLPFSLQMATAVKNMAQPTEVGQQIAPVMPPADPDQVVQDPDSASIAAAYKTLLKHLTGLEEAAEAELARYLVMEHLGDER